MLTELYFSSSMQTNQSASAPELNARAAGTQTDKSITKKENIELYTPEYESSYYSQHSMETEATTIASQPIQIHQPSRIAFLAKVYLLLALQVVLSLLQWMGTTYRWKPQVTAQERNIYLVLLFLTWLNMTLGFVGFRRLQNCFPLNWFVFVCMFECLTLLVMCLSVREFDLSWYLVLSGIGVLVLYTPLGLWMPPQLPPNLWILILSSILVVVLSTIALSVGLAMHIYLPITVSILLFGPWTMYNTYKLHAIPRENIRRYCFLSPAAKMFITYACTVAALVITIRIGRDAIEMDERCKSALICGRKSLSSS